MNLFGGFTSVFMKELLQLSRDPLTLLLMMGIPMVQLTIFGYAINTEVRNIRTAVHDLDRSADSRALLDAFANTDTFALVEYVESDQQLEHAIVSGRVKVGLKIPADYSDELAAGRDTAVMLLVDGSDSTVASTSVNVATSVGLRLSLRRVGTSAGIERLPIEVRPRMLFNPDSRSANFMVPGLVAIILQIVTTLLTAFSVVRERERGTLDQLLITPIRPLGLMLGKLLPYCLIGFGELCTVLLVMRVVFDVPIAGSLMMLLCLSTLFIFTALGIGLLISTKAQNQVQALQMGFLIMLPSVLLSGFMFPRNAMPTPIQVVSFLLPATHFVEIIRAIVLRNAAFTDVLQPTLVLAAMGIVLLGLSAARFRRTIG